jgi:hypothetical protein
MTTLRCALTALVPLALAAQACLSPVAPPAPETGVRLLTPFGPGRTLQRGAVVTERVDGRCFAPSIAVEGRPDAWRCMSGNRIMDPCFEGWRDGATVLACARAPWAPSVALLTLTEPLPDAPRPGAVGLDARPWALELADGSRCTFLTGATSAVAGLRVNYGCEGGAWIVGDVDRRSPVWKAWVITEDGAVAERRGVRTAWY